MALEGLRVWEPLRRLEYRGMCLIDRLRKACDVAGNSALHLAAASEHMGLCRALVKAGLSADEKNFAHLTPKDLAKEARNPAIEAFLSNAAAFECRFAFGGLGDNRAKDEALKDSRPIVEVTWWTIPIPHCIGKLSCSLSAVLPERFEGLRLQHSFVVLTVQNADTDKPEDLEQYLVDKMACDNGGSIKISYWDEGLWIQDKTVFKWASADQVRLGTTIKDVYDAAVKTGDYHLHQNCHHAARAVWNACIKSGLHSEDMPNKELCEFAERHPGFANLFRKYTESSHEHSGLPSEA
eukprot:3474700-Amphidinium_carterae.1